MTIFDFENFIKENGCFNMVKINYSKLLNSPVELWFWFSLKQNSAKAVSLDRDWLEFIKKKK